MGEMIERVARAIYEGRNGRGCKPWSLLPKAHKEPYMADARAAIVAMREPTKEITAMSYCADNAENLWPAMIDAALK